MAKDPAASKRSWTALDTLLTFCPPGPDARMNSNWISPWLRTMVSVTWIEFIAIFSRGNRSQVQACPGATALIHLDELKPMRPLDKRHSLLILVWARGSKFGVKVKEGIKYPKSSCKLLSYSNIRISIQFDFQQISKIGINMRDPWFMGLRRWTCSVRCIY